ncbi:hypothetical protein DRJ48_05300 [Candidatus Woesearchaeota archaeon]|nr:MAG: hypothetical protein DRJ48_05300 [Candidatus Woesearchaeota archaeon]
MSTNKNLTKIRSQLLSALVLCLIVGFGFLMFTSADPVGPRLIYNATEQPGMTTSPRLLNHTKGRITTVRFNVTQPNEDWKGYVGNVTGKLTLDDAQNYTLFDWTFTTTEGEVYATRGNQVSWTSIVCANATHVAAEDTALNHVASQSDQINETFANTTHPDFYTGDTYFAANECNFTLYTYVNDSASSTDFSEVLLYDTTNSNLIYTAIISDSTKGFDNKYYDFQMIVSEDSSLQTNIGYYFYVEVG